MLQPWLDEFKLACIEEDVEKIQALLEKYAPSSNLEELNQAKALMQEATKVLNQKKDILAVEINKLKIARNYTKHL